MLLCYYTSSDTNNYIKSHVGFRHSSAVASLADTAQRLSFNINDVDDASDHQRKHKINISQSYWGRATGIYERLEPCCGDYHVAK